MNILSLFVDESGTFNVYAKHIPYYIVSIVFHNQENDISREIFNLNNELKVYGISDNLVHTEPLTNYEIRKINPKDYKLFQAADFACSIELIAKKIETKALSRSESIIFKSIKAFKKDFLKELRKKSL